MKSTLASDHRRAHFGKVQFTPADVDGRRRRRIVANGLLEKGLIASVAKRLVDIHTFSKITFGGHLHPHCFVRLRDQAEVWKLVHNQIITNSTPATAGTTEEISGAEDTEDTDSMAMGLVDTGADSEQQDSVFFKTGRARKRKGSHLQRGSLLRRGRSLTTGERALSTEGSWGHVFDLRKGSREVHLGASRVMCFTRGDTGRAKSCDPSRDCSSLDPLLVGIHEPEIKNSHDPNLRLFVVSFSSGFCSFKRSRARALRLGAQICHRTRP
eukprot:3045388-Rhodomonas_salina.1